MLRTDNNPWPAMWIGVRKAIGANDNGRSRSIGLSSALRCGRHDLPPRPTPAQRRWLSRGLSEPGGKLPLFDSEGRQVGERTVRSCIERGWAEPWFSNPIKADWLVCKLTAAGRAILANGS